jgi:uncharacterized protein (DUF1800 family)
MRQLQVLTRGKNFVFLLLLWLLVTFATTLSAATTTIDIASLTIQFPGLHNVHATIRISDGIADSAIGKIVKKSNWKNNSTTVKVPQGLYDLVIRKGAGELIIDDVDCSTSTCTVNNIVAKLSINFSGLKSVHSSVHVTDEIEALASGKKVTQKNWQNDQAIIFILRQVVDVKIRKGNGIIVVDNVDCSSGRCSVDRLTATMKVLFPGMSGVHTSVRLPDGQAGKAEGKKITHSNWQKNQTKITVLRQKYDVSIKRNNSEPMVVDNVDCTLGSCIVDQITAIMLVKFPGMNGVHTSVRVADNKPEVAKGREVAKLNWQKNQARIPVFKQIYDVSVRRGKSAPFIIDAVDCTSGRCVVDQITARLTVDFPELKGVHTSVRVVDNQDDTAKGKEVAKLNWQKNRAVLTVFRQVYDVQVKKGHATKIVDNVDCTAGTCKVKELTANLGIQFPGLINVHSSVHIPDSSDDTAHGAIVAKSNWKKYQTVIPLLRGTYDVKVRHSVASVFDNVDCNSANCQVSIAGNVQAVLIDGNLNKPLANKSLIAYEKMPDGTLKKIMQGKTTMQGLVNFTLPGIISGKIYVLETYNPFGNGKSYYSAFITHEGEYKYIITADGENSLDLTPPKVTITSPQEGGNVTSTGFLVTGTATDNRKIDTVVLTIKDSVLGNSVINSRYDANSKSWSTNVPEAMITLNSTVVLTATAYDQAQNKMTTTVTVKVVKDNKGPEIEIFSHTDNDEVPVTGFMLSGTVTDLTGVAKLQATLVDSVSGETMIDQNIDFAINDGTWTLVVNNGTMSEGGTIDITLDATDKDSNASSKTIHLLVVAVDYSNAHMINRITFGPTPSLIQEVEILGALGFLEQQLDPDSIDDSKITEMMVGNRPTSKQELQAWTLMHMTFSKKQLQEVMTWFWDNHFNTDINTTRNNADGDSVSDTVAYELLENQAFRSNALGNFRDLLEISSKSPAMLIYLDSISNVVDDSNENYARELLELHTMGVNGGYTHNEIEAGAEIFTGWHIQNGAFFFDDSLHTAATHTMFKNTIQEVAIQQGGVEQGEQYLDALARHPSTANFICSKLVRMLVNDMPPQSLVGRCSDEFLAAYAADDQIKRVLRVILQSAEFNNVANYRSKIKTPVEFVVGALRLLDASSTATDLSGPIRAMGMRLYENPLPTGWSEIGSEWINSSLLIERIKWVNDFVRNPINSDNSSSDPLLFYPEHGFATAEGIVGFLLKLSMGDNITTLSQQNALQVLGDNFDLSNPDADFLLRQLNGTVLSYPQYQFQ